MLTRFQAVELLWEGTELSVSAAFCAVTLVERTGGFPVGHLRLGAAAAMAYKAHHCTPFDRMSEFVEYLLPQEWTLRAPDLAAEEMRLLERLGFAVPMRTRADMALDFLHGRGVDSAAVHRCLLTSLVVPSFADMTDEQHVRCIAFAAAYRCDVALLDLACEGVPPDYFVRHGLELIRFVP
jgi:hypothetical protein